MFRSCLTTTPAIQRSPRQIRRAIVADNNGVDTPPRLNDDRGHPTLLVAGRDTGNHEGLTRYIHLVKDQSAAEKLEELFPHQPGILKDSQ